MFATCGERSRTKANIRWSIASRSSPEPALSKAEWARMTKERKQADPRRSLPLLVLSKAEASKAEWARMTRERKQADPRLREDDEGR